MLPDHEDRQKDRLAVGPLLFTLARLFLERAHREILVLELKAAADVLGGLPGLRELPAGERNVAAGRAEGQVVARCCRAP